jgi:hypothetical protein
MEKVYKYKLKTNNCSSIRLDKETKEKVVKLSLPITTRHITIWPKSKAVKKDTQSYSSQEECAWY